MAKYFVMREIGSEDSKSFAVVSHDEAFIGKWKHAVLVAHGWFENESDARADAHSRIYPDYGA